MPFCFELQYIRKQCRLEDKWSFGGEIERSGVQCTMRIKRSIGVVAYFLVFSVLSVAQNSYFPQQSVDKFLVDYFALELKLLGERSFLELSKVPVSHSYRFLWLRTFNHPISVRLDIQGDGSGILVTKVGEGEGGYPGSTKSIIENNSQTLTVAQVEGFLTLVESVNFWRDPSSVVGDQTGTGGSYWVVEGTREGKYHVASRWSPNSKSSSKQAVRKLGMTLAIELAGIKVPANELY